MQIQFQFYYFSLYIFGFYRYTLLGSIKAWLIGDETKSEIKELWHDGLLCFPISCVMILLSYAGFYITEQTFNTEIPVINYRKISLKKFKF